MALFLDGPIPLEDTITFVQALPLPSNNKLTQMFGTKTYATDEIDMATIYQTNRAAKFRNWDGNFWISPRDTGLEKRVRMLPLGGQLAQGEYERRQMEFARYGGTIQSVLTDAIYNDLERLTASILNRIELAWGDVLADGVLTINENGVSQQLDYAIPTNQVVTAATLWSDTTNSNPLLDLIAWYDVYVALNGSGPGQFLMSLPTSRQLQANKNLINQIKGAQTGVTNVSLEDISTLFMSYGLPPISMDNVYNSKFDVDGVTTSAMPTNKFLFLPEDLSTLGFTAWGTPTTVMELASNNVQVETASGIIGILVREDQPPFQKRTFVDAVALPVLADPRKMLVATVA
ncbi:hypothetical protein D5S18_18610 [Nocardia panacis]|uniref:Major capsid protein E n=1 Tax=Nocardia panacis TaxID=2340916 RepID=A0A3A4KHT8_9NOCA|nr:major capsid protein [Nocardia panacis]RJO74166.1 hypothetical protein D5S18_18610 [Nocardia panacis]